MRTLRSLAVIVAVPLFAALAAPASASPPSTYHESYSFRGVAAEAGWFSEAEEPEPGQLMAFTVMGFDATLVNHAAGSKPQRMPQPALVAMAFWMPGENGGEPYPMEVWGMSDDVKFSYARDLSAATLEFEVLADVYVIDPETGEETPSGETMALSIGAEWTGVGDLFKDRAHSTFREDGTWSVDRKRATTRPANAYVTITGPEGTLFDGTIPWNADEQFGPTISKVMVGSIFHTRDFG